MGLGGATNQSVVIPASGTAQSASGQTACLIFFTPYDENVRFQEPLPFAAPILTFKICQILLPDCENHSSLGL